MHGVLCGADEKQLPRRFPACGIPEDLWSQVLLLGLPRSSLNINISISPCLAVHPLPKRLRQPPLKVCHTTRSVSFKTENSCHSKQKIAQGWRERITQGMLQKSSWHPALLGAGWGSKRGAEGNGCSWSLTRSHIVPGPIGWFLIHWQPKRHDQITAGPRIRFPVHLVLGTAPGFGEHMVRRRGQL